MNNHKELKPFEHLSDQEYQHYVNECKDNDKYYADLIRQACADRALQHREIMAKYKISIDYHNES